MRQLIADFETKNNGRSKKKRTKPVRKSKYIIGSYFNVSIWLCSQRKTIQKQVTVEYLSSDDNDGEDDSKPLVKRSYKWDNDIEMIHDMKQSEGDILYLVEYRNTGELDWVPREILVEKNPFKIIEFYETCIIWET